MEEVLHSGADESVHIMVKGKRSKRQRLSPSPALPPASSSPSTSSGSVTEEEEEDMAMANCLILLAQGPELDITAKDKDDDNNNNNNININKLSSRRFTETATTTDGKAGFYVYECKDCKKCFPSFQALGGHRTSHKRKRDASVAEEDELLKFSINSNSFVAKPLGSMPSSNNNNNNNNNILSLKMRVHECSICGAEFSSGQALGGHMRRHRPGSVPEVADTKKEKSLLSLDLNLPAPSDDHRGDGGETTMKETAKPAFSCVNKRPPLLLLSSAMVDCHY
ncbi:putative transcription factor C2H2 family [Dioscorea sansibarensis]